jgi:hypothetical protein
MKFDGTPKWKVFDEHHDTRPSHTPVTSPKSESLRREPSRQRNLRRPQKIRAYLVTQVAN